MKQFILALCIIGSTIAGPPPPECLKGLPPGKTQQECCQVPEIITQDLFKTCEASNPEPAGPPPPPGTDGHGMGKGCCIAECIMNTTGIMVAGKLDKAVAVTYLTSKMAGDAEAIKVVTAAVDTCSAEADKMKAEFDEMAKQPKPPGVKSCCPLSGFMIGCVNAQIYLNCPKDKYGADAGCAVIKAFADKCHFLYPAKM